MNVDKELQIVEVKTKQMELEVHSFELEQRRAMALSKSAFFPDSLKNDVASAVQIYDLATRMGISVLEVSQSVYIIYGRPSFATTFLVARLNQSGLIVGSLQTVISDDRQSSYCTATDKHGQKLVGMEITMAMARAEGWVGKKGSKWQTMPELMLRKRAQSFFIKEFFPQVMFGLQSMEESQDVVDVEVISAPKNDINVALATEQQPKVHQQYAQPTPKEKAKRVPRYISNYYFTLEQYGVKKHDMRKFVDSLDWMNVDEQVVIDFFRQSPAEVTRYVNAFYGITPNEPVEPNAIEADYDEAPHQAELPPGNQGVSQGHTEAKTLENNMPTQKVETGSLARYGGLFIKKGVLPNTINGFIDWAKLTPSNIGEVVADEGALDSLIEQYNYEMYPV